MQLNGTVGNGQINRPEGVVAVKRAVTRLGRYLPPEDGPHGIIERELDEAVRNYQQDRRSMSATSACGSSGRRCWCARGGSSSTSARRDRGHGAGNRALESSLVALLVHLVEYHHQPDRSSGRGSIVEHRRRVHESMKDSPSLRPYAPQVLAECYADVCEQAAAETGLAQGSFPAEPPFAIGQVLSTSYLPD